MSHKRTRRAFLSAAGGLVAAAAGCAATPPQNAPTEETPVETESTQTPPATTTTESGSTETDYEDVYREAIGSVGFIRVYAAGSQSQGSGFVYDDDYLVTNQHVVDGGEEFQVQFREGEWSRARLVGSDAFSDLAVLELLDRPGYATPLAFVEEGPATGAPVLALGAPFGLSESATAGIISARNRSLPAESGFRVPASVQTDAAVNPGNSGGPLLNMDGRVVGVVSAGGGENLAFAVSAAVCRQVLPALRSGGEFLHPYMGVQLTDVTPVLAQANTLELAQGAMVTGVMDDGPADNVLQAAEDTTTVRGSEVPVGGDIIREIGAQETRSVGRISQYLILEAGVGETVPVTVVRDGSRTTVDLTLERRPEEA